MIALQIVWNIGVEEQPPPRARTGDLAAAWGVRLLDQLPLRREARGVVGELVGLASRPRALREKRSPPSGTRRSFSSFSVCFSINSLAFSSVFAPRSSSTSTSFSRPPAATDPPDAQVECARTSPARRPSRRTSPGRGAPRGLPRQWAPGVGVVAALEQTETSAALVTRERTLCVLDQLYAAEAALPSPWSDRALRRRLEVRGAIFASRNSHRPRLLEGEVVVRAQTACARERRGQLRAPPAPAVRRRRGANLGPHVLPVARGRTPRPTAHHAAADPNACVAQKCAQKRALWRSRQRRSWRRRRRCSTLDASLGTPAALIGVFPVIVRTASRTTKIGAIARIVGEPLDRRTCSLWRARAAAAPLSTGVGTARRVAHQELADGIRVARRRARARAAAPRRSSRRGRGGSRGRSRR